MTANETNTHPTIENIINYVMMEANRADGSRLIVWREDEEEFVCEYNWKDEPKDVTFNYFVEDLSEELSDFAPLDSFRVVVEEAEETVVEAEVTEESAETAVVAETNEAAEMAALVDRIASGEIRGGVMAVDAQTEEYVEAFRCPDTPGNIGLRGGLADAFMSKWSKSLHPAEAAEEMLKFAPVRMWW